MAKNLEDVAIKGWNGGDNCLLSKSIIKEMSVLEFFKNLTTKSYQCGFNVEKSSFHEAQEVYITEIPYIYSHFSSLQYTKKGYFILQNIAVYVLNWSIIGL